MAPATFHAVIEPHPAPRVDVDDEQSQLPFEVEAQAPLPEPPKQIKPERQNADHPPPPPCCPVMMPGAMPAMLEPHAPADFYTIVTALAGAFALGALTGSLLANAFSKPYVVDFVEP